MFHILIGIGGLPVYLSTEPVCVITFTFLFTLLFLCGDDDTAKACFSSSRLRAFALLGLRASAVVGSFLGCRSLVFPPCISCFRTLFKYSYISSCLLFVHCK